MNVITRTVAASVLVATSQFCFPAYAAQPAGPTQAAATATINGSHVVTYDNVRLYYKDWGPKGGPVVTFSHGCHSARTAGSRR